MRGLRHYCRYFALLKKIIACRATFRARVIHRHAATMRIALMAHSFGARAQPRHHRRSIAATYRCWLRTDGQSSYPLSRQLRAPARTCLSTILSWHAHCLATGRLRRSYTSASHILITIFFSCFRATPAAMDKRRHAPGFLACQRRREAMARRSVLGT